MIQIQKISSSTKQRDSIQSAAFEQPLDLLLSCHDKIIHFSSALYKIAIALQQEGWNDDYAVSADQIRHYFNIAGPEHHLDEEQHLFPAIQALPDDSLDKKSDISTLIQRMISEHSKTDALWLLLDKMLAQRSEDFITLKKLSHQFKTEMHEHARIENDIIFPYARQHISVAEFKIMGLAIAQRRHH